MTDNNYRYIHKETGARYNDRYNAKQYCQIYCHPDENFGLRDDYEFEEHFEINEDIPEDD